MPTATVNGTTLDYTEEGTGDPIVFVHGGMADQRVWQHQVEAFGATHHAIAVSCRGSWPNDPPRQGDEISLDLHVDDLAAFIHALDVGPVHLVGHSSPGGFGSLLIAHHHPQLLRSVVLCEPAAFAVLGLTFPPRPPQVLRLLLRDPVTATAIMKFGARVIRPTMKAMKRGEDEVAIRTFVRANGATDEELDELMPMLRANFPAMKAQIDAGFPSLTAEQVASIRVPAMLVTGTQSPRMLRAVVDRLEAHLPDVRRLDIEEASHGMFVTHPDVFNRRVLEFVAARQPRPVDTTDTGPAQPPVGPVEP